MHHFESKASKPIDAPAPRPRNWRVDRLLSFAQLRFKEVGLNIRDCSRELNISRNYLGKLFREQTGVSFRQHLRMLRLSHAAALLRDTSMSVKEVTASAGYTEVSSLDRDFRMIYRLTPTEYRVALTSDQVSLNGNTKERLEFTIIKQTVHNAAGRA